MDVQNLGVPPGKTWGPKLPIFDVLRQYHDLNANIFEKNSY